MAPWHEQANGQVQVASKFTSQQACGHDVEKAM
jgi:hypothetical protein